MFLNNLEQLKNKKAKYLLGIENISRNNKLSPVLA